jgi:hypothetical protein
MVAPGIVRGVAVMVSALLFAACELPATREQREAQQQIEAVPGVSRVNVACNDNFSAASDLCADVAMNDGTRMRFVGIGHRAFGAMATTVQVSEAGGRSPRVVSCRDQGPPKVADAADFHRSGAFGHHLKPTMLDVADAVRRRKEIIVQLQFWPECPQFWEVDSRDGAHHRYCAHQAGINSPAPPPHPACASR